jgi:energy-coupling factor transport system ATP-binding protein
MSIIFNKVNFTYNYKTIYQQEVLKDISFDLKPGITALIGGTGAGKSTLMKHFNGLLLPTSGTIKINDFQLKAGKKIEHAKKLRQQVGMVFQFPEYQLFEETVEKDIMFGPRNFLVLKKLSLWNEISKFETKFSKKIKLYFKL